MPAKKLSAAPALERIREIAYRLWSEAGCPEGTAEADWLAAERIAAEESAAPKARKAPARGKAA